MPPASLSDQPVQAVRAAVPQPPASSTPSCGSRVRSQPFRVSRRREGRGTRPQLRSTPVRRPLVCHIVVTLGCPSVAATRVRADSPAGPRRISYSSGRPWSDRHCEEIAVSSDEDAGRSQSLRSLRSLRHRTYGCRGVQLHGKTARTKCRNLNGVSWVPMSAA